MGIEMVSKRDLPVLDRWRADEILEPERPIWGLPTIAKVLGVSVDTARRWAKEPAVPITQPEGSGSYFAYKSELVSWLRQKKTNGCP
jgi:hypothetical protein